MTRTPHHRRPMGARGNRRGGGARAASAPAFVPSDIAGQEFWYRGDDTVDVGGVVQTWSDKSGNARHVTQATAAARPTPATRNGQRALSFDGGDWLQGAFAGALAQPNTLYLVWEPSGLASTRLILDGDGAANRIFFYTSTATISASAGSVLSGATASVGQIYGSAVVVNGGTSALYGASNFVTAGASGAMGAGTLDGLTIGSNYLGAGFFTGYVWEVIGYSGAHNAATRKQIGDYFTSRYTGLTVTT